MKDWKRYRKRPVVIEAAELEDEIVIKTREGELKGYPGDKLIKGIEGEIYPCDPEIFDKTYDLVDDETTDDIVKSALEALETEPSNLDHVHTVYIKSTDEWVTLEELADRTIKRSLK